MTRKQETGKGTMELVRDCFDELGLTVLKEKSTKVGVILETQINAASFSMSLQIGGLPNDSTLYMMAWFSLGVRVKKYDTVYQLVNVINDFIMDIGHFAVDTGDGAIHILGGLDIGGEEYSRRQLVATLERFIYHGTHCFPYLVRMCAPENWSQEGVENVVDEMVGKFSKGRKSGQTDNIKALEVLAIIEECFREAGHVIVARINQMNEYESGGCVRFIATLGGTKPPIGIQTRFWPEFEMIELLMHFVDEWPEKLFPTFLKLINDINLRSGPCYFTKVQRVPKIELRTAYLLAGEPFNKTQFNSLFDTFVSIGLFEYRNFKKFLANSGEAPN